MIAKATKDEIWMMNMAELLTQGQLADHLPDEVQEILKSIDYDE